MTRNFFWLALLLALATAVRADQVELNDGSLVKGRILAVDGGKLKIETSFVGTVSIALSEIRAFATSDPVNVAMAGSPPVLARVYSAAAGVTVQGEALRLQAKPSQVTSLWREGAESPAARLARETTEKARRKWTYEATAAISGRSGARDKLNAALGMKATLASATDRLILTATVERAEDSGLQTANREFVGGDYSAFTSKDWGWYVRSSVETDRIKSIDFRSSSALGFTRKLVRRSSLDLEFRSGGSYQYETYPSGGTFSSPGLDFNLLSTWAVRGAKVSTSLSYLPTFRDFSNFRLLHQSGLEVPLSVSLWKLKLGLSNEYLSVPQSGVDKFDTTYFTSLLLNWK